MILEGAPPLPRYRAGTLEQHFLRHNQGLVAEARGWAGPPSQGQQGPRLGRAAAKGSCRPLSPLDSVREQLKMQRSSVCGASSCLLCLCMP